MAVAAIVVVFALIPSSSSVCGPAEAAAVAEAEACAGREESGSEENGDEDPCREPPAPPISVQA